VKQTQGVTSVTRFEYYFNYTRIDVNNSMTVNFDVNDIYPAGELLFPLGFALQNHIDLQLDSLEGDMNVLLVYPNNFFRDLCFIFRDKIACNSLIWNDEFYPGSSFDIVIKNTQNKGPIEMTGFIKVQQKDKTFNLATFIGMSIGIFLGSLCA